VDESMNLRRVTLPLDGDDGQRRYRLGSITLAQET